MINKFIGFQWGLLIAQLAISSMAHSYPGESILFDPTTGNYLIRYWNPEIDPPGLETTTFVPATKIDPAVRSRFENTEKGDIAYRYTVINSTQGKQILGHIFFEPIISVIGTFDDSNEGLSNPAESARSRALLKANKAALAPPPNGREL